MGDLQVAMTAQNHFVANLRHPLPRTAMPMSTTRLFDAFAAPRCEQCGGLLKPDVVFFGENVPAERYAHARSGPCGSPTRCSSPAPR